MRSILASDWDGPSNEDRALWAHRALVLFFEETGLDSELEKREAVSDLLCNLGHYCDFCEIDFLPVVSSAIGVWDAEKREVTDGNPDALYPEKVVRIVLLDPE